MQVSGVCTMCGGLARPSYSCEACGVTVCKRCFDEDLSICKRCSAMMSR